MELGLLGIYFITMLKGLQWKILNRCNSHALKTDQKGVGRGAVTEPRYCKMHIKCLPNPFVQNPQIKGVVSSQRNQGCYFLKE